MRQVIPQALSLDHTVALLLPLTVTCEVRRAHQYGSVSCKVWETPGEGDAKATETRCFLCLPLCFPLNFHPQSSFPPLFPLLALTPSLSPTCSSIIEVLTIYSKLHTFKVNNLIHFDYNLLNHHHNQEKEHSSMPNFLMLILIPPSLPFANTFSFPGNE